MTITREDLAGDRRRREPEPNTDILLDERGKMGEGPDCPRELAAGDRLFGSPETVEVASGFGIPERQLQTKGERLRVDAMRPANHDRLFVATGQVGENEAQGLQLLYKNSGRLLKLDREGGVHHIVGGQSQMDVARLRPDAFRHRRDKGDDVMANLPLDLLDPIEVVAGPLPDHGQRLARNLPQLGPGLAGQQLDAKPGIVTMLRLPDGHHPWTRIARDHRSSS